MNIEVAHGDGLYHSAGGWTVESAIIIEGFHEPSERFLGRFQLGVSIISPMRWGVIHVYETDNYLVFDLRRIQLEFHGQDVRSREGAEPGDAC